MSQVRERLALLTRSACEDALFAILGSGPRILDGIAKRREPAHDAIARGETAVTMSELDPWLAALANAAAPLATPWFVPMRTAIDDGLTLEREARGLRAILGGSGAQERIRQVGIFATRVLRAVSAADGVVSEDEQRAISLLVAAMGLSDEDARVLAHEAPMPASAIEIPSELEWNLARAILLGAWEAAATDGIDPAEHDLILEFARRLSVQEEVLEEARLGAEKHAAEQLAVGLAAVDVVRYVAQPLEPAIVAPLVNATARLSVPPYRLAECLRSIASETTTPLAKDHHDLDRAGKHVALCAAWAVALWSDPTVTTRARLAARHDRAATDLGSDRAGSDARDVVEDYLDAVLARGVGIAGV
jgi:tellurite resistance protein